MWLKRRIAVYACELGLLEHCHGLVLHDVRLVLARVAHVGVAVVREAGVVEHAGGAVDYGVKVLPAVWEVLAAQPLRFVVVVDEFADEVVVVAGVLRAEVVRIGYIESVGAGRGQISGPRLMKGPICHILATSIAPHSARRTWHHDPSLIFTAQQLPNDTVHGICYPMHGKLL